MQKQQVLIKLKTVMFILGLFGISTFGGLTVFIRSGAWLLLAPAVKAYTDTVVVRERVRTDSVVRVNVQVIADSMARGQNRIADMLLDVPQVRLAQQKKEIERARQEQRRRDKLRFFGQD